MGRHSFENKIKRNVVQQAMAEGVQSGYGVILEYDKKTNTASVLMSQGTSDLPGEILHKVPCPMPSPGVQGVSPEMGMQCWVEFKAKSMNHPVITSFFNHFYDQVNFAKLTNARAPLPRFMYSI